MSVITQWARTDTIQNSAPETLAKDVFGSGRALVARLRDAGIDISAADRATRRKYDAFDVHRPLLHPACALWLATACLASGDDRLFREVVTTFHLTRLQGIVEGAGIVARCLKDLPWVHQVEFAPGALLTADGIAELVNALRDRRDAPFELDLHGCRFSGEALGSLAAALPGLCGLAMLSLSDPVTGEADWMTRLGDALAVNTELVAFKLDVPALSPAGAQAIGRGLRGNRSLTELHLRASTTGLACLLDHLAQGDSPDPNHPGFAVRALKSVSIVGRDLLPESPAPVSVSSLVRLAACCPDLTHVCILPGVEVASHRELMQLLAFCGSNLRWVDTRVQTRWGWFGESGDGDPIHSVTAQPIAPDLAFIRRKDTPHRIREQAAMQCHAAVPRFLAAMFSVEVTNALPFDVIDEIARHLLAHLRPAIERLDTASTLSRINRRTAALDSVARQTRDTHFERLKGLMTFSAFAFEAHELAGPLCLKLAGMPLQPPQEESLKSLIEAKRPDTDRLKEAIAMAEDARWEAQQGQLREMWHYGFKREFLEEHQQWTRSVATSGWRGFPFGVENMNLAGMAGYLTLKHTVRDVVSEMAPSLRGLRKNDS